MSSEFSGSAKNSCQKPNRIFIEIRALQNGNAKLQKGIEKKRREGQLIGLVVEPVSGPQILGKGLTSRNPFGRFLADARTRSGIF